VRNREGSGGVSASSHSASCFRGGSAGEGKPTDMTGTFSLIVTLLFRGEGAILSSSSRGVDRSTPRKRAETRTRVGSGE
jgi:hypothetical protein